MDNKMIITEMNANFNKLDKGLKTLETIKTAFQTLNKDVECIGLRLKLLQVKYVPVIEAFYKERKNQTILKNEFFSSIFGTSKSTTDEIIKIYKVSLQFPTILDSSNPSKEILLYGCDKGKYFLKPTKVESEAATVTVTPTIETPTAKTDSIDLTEIAAPKDANSTLIKKIEVVNGLRSKIAKLLSQLETAEMELQTLQTAKA